ncbi:MAG TPA: hypothetical protein VK509_16765 [Polyangiales bacterium]|nr:hypothetical protein [Polyangiales bacterium]
MQPLAAIAVAFVLLLASSAAAQQGTRVDGIAAVVGASAPGPGADVILQSDVELRARLSLAASVADPGALDVLPSSLLRATLSQLIGESLIAREARRVQATAPDRADVERERKRLVRSAGGGDRVQRLLFALAASDDELDTIAQRRAQVGAFLSANLEGVTVVTERELARAYSSAGPELAGRTQEQAFAELRARLSKQALDRTIERWVTVLGARTPVRRYVQY